MVFDRLHSLQKLSLERICQVFDHIVDVKGVSTDSCKVESIANMTSADLKDLHGVTPSWRRIRSF